MFKQMGKKKLQFYAKQNFLISTFAYATLPWSLFLLIMALDCYKHQLSDVLTLLWVETEGAVDLTAPHSDCLAVPVREGRLLLV